MQLPVGFKELKPEILKECKMKTWGLFFILFYCSGAMCAPSLSETTSTTAKNGDGESTGTSVEASVPTNMNIADYYYSIFGKHLDYDYREPMLTFNEPSKNELSDEVLSEVDKESPDPWDTDVHSRKKRFILVPAGLLNSTIQWTRQMRRLRAERMRLRNERRRQWQENRIRYLTARSESLQKQAARLTQLQQRQQAQAAATRQVTRSASEPAQNMHRIVLHVTTTTTTARPISVNQDPVPVRQIPIPTKK